MGPESPVEEAEIMENLGEFPARLADQGDRMTAPNTKARARRLLKEG
jgi:hypothetical protein